MPVVSLLPRPVALLAAGLPVAGDYAVGENESKARPVKPLGSGIVCFHQRVLVTGTVSGSQHSRGSTEKSEYMREKDEQA